MERLDSCVFPPTSGRATYKQVWQLPTPAPRNWFVFILIASSDRSFTYNYVSKIVKAFESVPVSPLSPTFLPMSPPPTDDFSKESAAELLSSTTTSSLHQGIILLEPPADAEPSFRSNSRTEVQLHNVERCIPTYSHGVQAQDSTYPKRSIGDRDQLPNFYHHMQ